MINFIAIPEHISVKIRHVLYSGNASVFAQPHQSSPTYQFVLGLFQPHHYYVSKLYIQPSSSGTNSASVNVVSKAGLRLILILVPFHFTFVDGEEVESRWFYVWNGFCQFWCKQIIGLDFLEFDKN